jgi:hypothetical protein
VSVVPARKLHLVAVSLALASVLAACGHTHQVGAGRIVRMALTEYRLNPQSIHASDGVLAIVVHNYGRLTHNLVVSLNGGNVAGTKPIPPGQTAELDLDLAPGTYQMASTILSDQDLGAYGTLKVS